MTPYEAMFKEKPDIADMRIFGCVAFVHVEKQKRDKLDDRAFKGVFVGYAGKTRGYLVYNPTTKKLVTSRNVTFDEKQRGGQLIRNSAHVQVADDGDEEDDVSLPQLTSDKKLAVEVVPEVIPVVNEQASNNNNASRAPAPAHPTTVTKYGRTSKPLTLPYEQFTKRKGDGANLVQSNLDDDSNMHYALEVVGHDDDDITPHTFEEAVSGADAQLWREAMAKEMESLGANNVWELTTIPEGRKLVGCKWVFKIKRKADGSVDKYKARLVAQGYSQVEGFDYQETFSPVIKMTTLRTLIAVSAHYGYDMSQSDVTTAFLHSEVDEDIYMRQPPGHEVVGKDGQTLACHLRKSLYGLKQAGRNWNQRLDEFMKINGMRRCESDHCLYLSDGSVYRGWFAVGVYVDDNIMCAEHVSDRDEFMRRFQKTFTVEDAKPLSWCLGINIEYSNEYITMSQEKYISDMAKRFSMEFANVQLTPAADTRLTANDCPEQGSAEQLDMRERPYRSLVGSLNYAATSTRVDVAYAVGAVCAFAENPGEVHWTAAKRILRYLKGTAKDGLMYRRNVSGPLVLVGYCDADWAGDVDQRRSFTGYVFTLGSGAISWASKKQTTVALSSAEAEYMAISAAAQELIWLRALLKEMGFEQKGPTMLQNDNRGAVALTKDPVDSKRTKHIDVRHHFVRQLREENVLIVENVSTDKMPADFLTKPVAKHVQRMCKAIVMNVGAVGQDQCD